MAMHDDSAGAGVWDRLHRRTRIIRWSAAGVMAVSVLLFMRVLPWRGAFDGIGAWVESLGPWAPIVFIALYVGTTLLLLPGWWLSLLAGTLFGLWWGLVLTSAASTVAVAAAFLIARHLARRRVEEAGRNSPALRALDSAVREGGWRIVALVRLSPVFPFGLQNYIYGLTPIGFWTCVVTSWAAMLPGNFLYVYLGNLTRVGADAAATPTDAGAGVWTLRIAGLIATIVSVAYLTGLAQRTLREQTQLVGAAAPPKEHDMAAPPSNAKTVVLAVIAVLMFVGSVYAQFNRAGVYGLVAGVVGASNTAGAEAFAEKVGGPTVDHSRLGALLQRVVTDDGMVDYELLREDADDLDAYLEMLARVDMDALGRDEKLALLINAYNAFTLQLIVDHWPVDSIKDIPQDQRWDAKRWKLGGHTLSLSEIEHEWLRKKFVEPRIHFAINCASVGCPPLLDEAYVGGRIDEQLEQVTRIVHRNGSRWFQFDAEAGVVKLTKLYDWYGKDFEQVADSPLDFAARYVSTLKEAIDAGQRPRIAWIDYDWSLNRKGAPTD